MPMPAAFWRVCCWARCCDRVRWSPTAPRATSAPPWASWPARPVFWPCYWRWGACCRSSVVVFRGLDRVQQAANAVVRPIQLFVADTLLLKVADFGIQTPHFAGPARVVLVPPNLADGVLVLRVQAPEDVVFDGEHGVADVAGGAIEARVIGKVARRVADHAAVRCAAGNSIRHQVYATMGTPPALPGTGIHRWAVYKSTYELERAVLTCRTGCPPPYAA